MQPDHKFSVNSRRMFLFLLSVLFLAGCSGEDADLDDKTNVKAIGFDCQTRNLNENLRIAETTIDNLQYFRVSAIWNKDGVNYESYMDKQLVEKQGNNWVYSPIKYWPGYGTVSFFAYTPATSSGIELFYIDNIANQISIRYHVSNNHQQQEDFMVATNLEQTNSPVQLDFEHALSFVEFKARSYVTGITFRINEIKLSNLYSKGVITGLPSGATSTWMWYEERMPIDYIVYQKYSFETQGTTYKDVGSLMVLPQEPESNFKISVTYDILERSESKISEYTLDNDFVFEMGKKYTFLLTLDPQSTRTLEQSDTTASSSELILHIVEEPYNQ